MMLKYSFGQDVEGTVDAEVFTKVKVCEESQRSVLLSSSGS